jgi:hypothetical protein
VSGVTMPDFLALSTSRTGKPKSRRPPLSAREKRRRAALAGPAAEAAAGKATAAAGKARQKLALTPGDHKRRHAAYATAYHENWTLYFAALRQLCVDLADVVRAKGKPVADPTRGGRFGAEWRAVYDSEPCARNLAAGLPIIQTDIDLRLIELLELDPPLLPGERRQETGADPTRSRVRAMEAGGWLLPKAMFTSFRRRVRELIAECDQRHKCAGLLLTDPAALDALDQSRQQELTL